MLKALSLNFSLNRRLYIIAALIFVLIGVSFGLASINSNANAQTATTVSRVFGIRLDGNVQSTTINIRMDKATPYRIFTLPAPTPRLVIDFNRVEWAMGRGASGSLNGQGLVKQMRFAQKSSTESRLVIDLAGPIRINSQTYGGIIGSKVLSVSIVPSNNQAFAAGSAAAVKNTPKLNVPAPLSPRSQRGRYVIVIDAGHGGHDPGAIGVSPGVKESDVTLASARQLAQYLRLDPRFHVVMSRDSDIFIPLDRRIILARDIRADLFISLHADAAPPNARVRGATVYTLSEQATERSRRLLNRDNWTIAPPNRANDNIVTEILRDLTQRDTKNQSAVFAEAIIKEIRGVGPITSSSHRRAGFFVLLSPTVPAVLFEMGFVTDVEDEKRLTDPGFRRRQMGGVAKAIDNYFDQIDIRARGSRSR